jgi:hypothetical protein
MGDCYVQADGRQCAVPFVDDGYGGCNAPSGCDTSHLNPTRESDNDCVHKMGHAMSEQRARTDWTKQVHVNECHAQHHEWGWGTASLTPKSGAF